MMESTYENSYYTLQVDMKCIVVCFPKSPHFLAPFPRFPCFCFTSPHSRLGWEIHDTHSQRSIHLQFSNSIQMIYRSFISEE